MTEMPEWRPVADRAARISDYDYRLNCIIEEYLDILFIESLAFDINLKKTPTPPKCHSKRLEAMTESCDKLKDSIDAFTQEALVLENIEVKEINCMIKELESLYQWIQKEDLIFWQRAQQAIDRLLRLFECLYAREDAHQGGFRNLLLDGWWLEFWEIVLLAAGDIERNPGPRIITDQELAKVSDRPIEEDDLSLVFDMLLPVSAKWSRLCCSLGLRASLLDTIKKNHPGDMDQCLFEGLQQWVQRNYNTEKHDLPTWRSLVAAVDNSSGGHNHALALEIAEKHQVQNDPTYVATLRKDTGTHDIDREDLMERHHQSAAFSRTFGSITRLIGRSLRVAELKQFLRYFSNPLSPSQRYIDPSVYEGTESKSARDILDCLYPDYINPENTYLLEEIVRNFGSFKCKKCLEEYTSEYY